MIFLIADLYVTDGTSLGSLRISALRGRGFGSKPGPARSPRAGPLHNFVDRAGPGPTYCGPMPGLS